MRVIKISMLAMAAVLASGCVREARIAMPSEVRASTEQVELSGLGGSDRGEFRLGESRGRFRRHALEMRGDDVFVRKVGGGSFDVAGPELGGQLSARCGYNEDEVDTGLVTVTTARMAYGCEFERGGIPIQGGLLLAEVPTSGGLLAGRTRAGELQIGDLRIGIRAIHVMEGGRLPTGDPLGYAFDVDGRQIGAVDLNGGSKTIHAPAAPGPERQAVLIASLALSIFWEPAD